MNRKEELKNIVGENEELANELIEEIVFLEDNLRALKKLPFIRTNPKNPRQQKATPAAKQYKEFLQQYTNCIKTLARLTGQNDKDEDSPLRKWVREKC